MHIVVDGRLWENDSAAIVNKNLVTALFRLGYDVRLEAWGQGFDKPHKDAFLNRDLLTTLAQREKDYENAVVIRQSWPVCEPYYSSWCNWNNIPGKIKIGMLLWESDHVPKRWLTNMASVDAILTISPFSAERIRKELERNYITTPVWAVPLGVDQRLFNPTVEPWKIDGAKKFKFLHVGVGQARKGSDLLRQAYFEEFTDKDDVSLVVKTGGWDTVDAWASPSGGPHVLAIHDDNISETSLGGLYTACDCLVHPSRLEGFGMTMLEAMACHTLVICPEQGAHRVFANEDNALLVHGEEEQMDFFEDLVTTAYRVDIADLRRTMRDAVNEAPWDDKTVVGLKTARQFSWNSTAAHIASLIETTFNVKLEGL
jgi:glycosyltransferase involved in cell wall biosynthesis